MLSSKKIGIMKYLDGFYAEAGGYPRFVQMVTDGVPNTKIAKHFGVSRETIRNWRNQMEA